MNNTIEERAKSIYNLDTNKDDLNLAQYHAYVRGAREQDLISRSEELEKCAEVAVSILKDSLPNCEYITNLSVFRQDKERYIESFKKILLEKCSIQ